MNDPGLQQPIDNAEGQVKTQHEGSTDMDEEEEEKNFLLPAKWWYASTAFPLMAGTFGPMANAFNLCGLVENWRVIVPKGGSEEHGIKIKDPKWLIGVNAVSLVFALIANISLLLNMARRLPFPIAQPITILGFWTASIILIGLIIKAAHDFRAPGVHDQALTQAYYYAIFAAGLYQIIAYLMCVTAWGAWRGHYSRDFKLTIAQRTLMLQTIMFLAYLLLGALVYSKIEGWEFLDAVYWADFTCLTIGIGDDYTPETHLGRALLFPFALGGIVILGLVVGSIRSLVLDRSKRKMAARITEKTRRRVVKRVAKMNSKHTAGIRTKGVHGLDKTTSNILALEPDDSRASELQRRRAEFEAMRAVQAMAAKEQKWFSLGISAMSFAVLWFIGAVVFWQAETNQSWTYFGSLYFSYTTLLTIGYGDFQPISNSGKPFFVFWSLLAIPALTILISDMGDTVVKVVKDLTIWLGEITVLPSEQGGILDRLRYGLYRATLGKVNFNVGDQHSEGDDSEEDDDDMKRFQEMNPGLIKMPRREEGRRRHRRSKRDVEQGDEFAADFENAEKDEEKEAREQGDTIAEDDHHYRHILISQIRKVWDDSNSAVPKKYSYPEWAFFLRLLGEDENDGKFHRVPPTKENGGIVDRPHPEGSHKNQAALEKEEFKTAGQQDAHTSGEQHDNKEGNEGITKWSWIGTRSPLMGDKDESEWLLEKLFQRLEESLKESWNKHKKETRDGKGGATKERGSRHGSSSTGESRERSSGEDEITVQDPKSSSLDNLASEGQKQESHEESDQKDSSPTKNPDSDPLDEEGYQKGVNEMTLK